MEEAGVIGQTALVFGQMDEPPGTRLRVALSALTMAEYFRDVQNQDVLLFIDNIFRFTQAGSEVSTLLGRMPSAVGYQPNLADEMGTLQERITSTRGHSITSMQAIYVPADDYTDPAPATTFAHLDATTELSREIASLGIYPAVDPLTSTSRILDAQYIGQDALRLRDPDQADPPAQQGAPGHHRDPRCRRALRGGQDHRLPGAPASSGSCRRTPTWPSSSPASRARRCRSRTHRGVQQDRRRRVRPRGRAGVLHVRRSGRRRAQVGRDPEEPRDRWLTHLQVELVAADRTVWSGEATMVIARTVEGDIGILPGHAPVLSLLTDGDRRDRTPRTGRPGGRRRRRVPLGRQRPGLDPRPSTPSSSHEIDVERGSARARGGQGRRRATTPTSAGSGAAEARIRAAEKPLDP